MPSSTSNGVPATNATSESVEHNTSGDDERPSKIAKLENNLSLPTIEEKYHDLQLAHKSLQDELKRLQQQDFNARYKEEGQSHYVVSAQFVDVFQLSTDWARDYFKVPFSAFRIDDYELFRKNLDGVLCGGCHWWKKKKMNVSHLVQAVVAEVLARRILLPQFIGCPESARHEFGQIYDAILKENESNAQKWRATTFKAYGQCEVWKSFDPSVSPEPISSLRQNFYKSIAVEIDTIVGPIARTHFRDRGDDEERFQRSMEFIEAAGKLAITLGRQAAKLEIMDKSWFERSKRVFVCDDDRMKGRFMEEYEESEEGYQVDIILRPGFLKYGNDEGEDLEKYAIWIPAMLDLSENSGYEDAQETINGDMMRDDTTTQYTQQEKLSAQLLNGGTATTEPSFDEPVVLLPAAPPPHQDQQPPQPENTNTETEINTGILPPPGEPTELHRKPSKRITQDEGEVNPQTTPTPERRRRRDKYFGWLKPKKLLTGTSGKARKQKRTRSP